MSARLRRGLTPLLLSLAVSSALLSACDRSKAPDASAPAAKTEAPAKPVLGGFGFDTAGMDRTQVAGDDFFAYANGTWAKNTEIPADRSSWNSFGTLADRTQSDIRAIIEEAAANKSATGDTRKIGDYYTALMDEAGIEAKGLAPIQPELDAIAAIKDKAELSRALGGTLRADVDILNTADGYTDRLFGLWVTQHLDRPNEVAPYLIQGGLGMPDRDFYLGDGRMAEMRKAYQAHVAKVLTLAGVADADAKAAKILALETAIAKTHANAVDSNDVKKGANYWSPETFAAKAPGLDWVAYFDAAGLATQKEFVVWQPGAVSGIAKLVGSQDLETWKAYLAFHALDRAAATLPKAFGDENFAFYGTTMSGTPKQQDRWKRAVNATNGALGEAIGKVYVERHFTPATKARADEMVKNLITAFGRRIDAIEWMTPETKAAAKAKLGTLQIGMGYPDRWRDYSALEVRADDAYGNAQRAGLADYREQIAKLGKPMDRSEWYMLPQEVNALNIPLENRLIFPAAILQAPFFDGAADDAINYGAMGAVIGHEITHSFDSSGALFDANGRFVNWWKPEDLKKFEAAGDALAAQFDGYEPFPGVHVNGRLTLAENIADVAGLATAYDAYRLSQEGKEAKTIDGFTPDQRFFLGWAQAWRGKQREAALRNSLLTNGHAPPQYRSETVRNQDAWYGAFDVKPGQKRYLAPEQRVKVW